MTFDQFKKLWKATTWAKVVNPKIVDNGLSRNTQDALVKASSGDMSGFDNAKRMMKLQQPEGKYPARRIYYRTTRHD